MSANTSSTRWQGSPEPDQRFVGRRVVVMGLGGFGGGAGAARWLTQQGAKVLVTDLADAGTLDDAVGSLSDCDIEYRLGGHDEADLDRADLLVVNPAVPKKRSEFFQAAVRRGIRWTTEINLFLERCRATVIGVTGTAGKSTAAAMIHAVLSRQSRGGPHGGPYVTADPRSATRGLGTCYLGGNFGGSLLGDLDRMTANDTVVLELSSFQLADLPLIERRPDVAVYVEIWPNHLDRHGTYETYLACKLNMIRGANTGTPVVLGLEDPATSRRITELCEPTGCNPWALRAVAVDKPVPALALKVRGAHNLRHANCAATVGTLLGVHRDAIRASLEAFSGLGHRLQFVGCFGGVDYYNDSKSTNTRSTAAALGSFDQPVIALVGGALKPTDSNPWAWGERDVLASALRDGARATICFGPAGKMVRRALMKIGGSGMDADVHWVATLEEAVASAKKIGRRGDVVVLSPGFQSYDAFANYERRGEAFMSVVRSGGR
ncbi:MAG: UDP-N-acetylmuramoyl-L-alanine--D-glutamate ligase [Phycisphaerae bacterium]